MRIRLVLSMAKRPDPFDWMKPGWLRRWTARPQGRNAFRDRAAKPRMTPQEARRDHAMMLRFLGLHALMGAMIGTAVAISLVVLDIGGLGRLVSRATLPAVPLLLVIVPFASLFGAAATASAVLTLPYERKYREEDGPDSKA